MKNNEIFNALGRISRQTGSSDILGFMPLKDFHTELALDFSTITSLRMKNIYDNKNLISNISIKNWIYTLGLEIISDAFASYKNYNLFEVFEICGGISPLKDFLISKNFIDETNSYNIVASQDKKEHIKLVFNKNFITYKDFLSFKFFEDKSKLVIFNQNYSIRNSFLKDVNWIDEIVNCKNSHIIACLRLTDKNPRMATTIKGNQVWINSVSDFLNNKKLKKGNWHYKFIHNFDTKFILPKIKNNKFVKGENTLVCIAIKGTNTPPLDFNRLN